MRGKLLPRIKKHNGCTLEQCHQKNLPIKGQPIGASGQELGATSIVAIETTMEQAEQKLVISCSVLTSAKPIWQGAVENCTMVLGTNTMVKFGIQIVHVDGSVARPSAEDTMEHAEGSSVGNIVLVRAVNLAVTDHKCKGNDSGWLQGQH